MTNRFTGARPAGLGRRTFWIVIVTIVMMLAWAGISLGDGGPYFELDPDGMMRPDGTITQRQPGHRPNIKYKVTHGPGGVYIILRNGVPWITLAQKPKHYVLSDPNGSGDPVVILDQSTSH